MGGKDLQGKGYLALSGTLSVDRAAALKASLLEGLGGGSELTIDFAAVDDLDLSCLQVLLAAMLHSAKSGPALHLTGALSPKVARRLHASGLTPHRASRGEDLELRLREALGAEA